MFRIVQVVLFLFCFILYHATGITVDECTSTEVVFTVTDGVAGGKAFIEGTGVTDTECFPDLDGSSSQTLVMRYSACGVTPTELSFGTIIEFVIIVQDSPIINTISDDRYAVECSFGETTDTINVELLTSSTSPLNYIQKPFAITPKPVMFLYYTVNDSLVNNNIVPLGTEVSLKITIDQLIPSYNVIVEHCNMLASDLSGVLLPNPVQLISIVTKCSEIPAQFPSFTYVTHPATSTSGDTFDVSVAFSNYSSFTPTLLGYSLTDDLINIQISCRVRVCIHSLCTPVNCTDSVARRRREATNTSSDDIASNDTIYDLNEFYRVSFGSIGNDVTGYEIGENDICMEETSFYGVIFSLLALLVASWAFMCCIFMYMRRRRRKDSKTITVVDSSATKISTLTPSPEKPIKTVPIALPRYFPVTVGSFSDRSGSA